MIHVFIDEYDANGNIRRMRLEMDSELRPQVLRLLDNINNLLEKPKSES